MTVHSYFPSVTDEWPFQNHLLSTTLLIHKAAPWKMLCLSGDLNEHAEASSVSQVNGLFKTIFQGQLY